MCLCVCVCVCVERNDHVGESLSKKEGMNNGDQGPLYVLDVNKIANEKRKVTSLFNNQCAK